MLAPSSVSRLMSPFQPRPEGGGGERKKREGGREEGWSKSIMEDTPAVYLADYLQEKRREREGRGGEILYSGKFSWVQIFTKIPFPL